MGTTTLSLIFNNFQNDDEFLDAIFVYNSQEEKPSLSGSVTWGKEGRHFMIEQCNNVPLVECSLWSEVDPSYWYAIPEPLQPLPMPYAYKSVL